MSFEIDSWINRSFAREHKKKRKEIYFVDKIQKFEFTFALRYKLQKVHSTRCYTRSDLRLFYLILASVVILLLLEVLWNISSLSSSYLVKLIAFNVFSLESYYAHNSTLIIDECKKMIQIAKYMIQREFADFIIKRQHAVNERLKQVWSWIKNDKIWKEFHTKFEKFEEDYSNVVSLIRRAWDFIKLKLKVVITIINEWEFNVKCFNVFSLHMMRAIRKCAIRYSFVKALQMTKRAVLHRLDRTVQEIFRSLMFNAAN